MIKNSQLAALCVWILCIFVGCAPVNAPDGGGNTPLPTLILIPVPPTATPSPPTPTPTLQPLLRPADMVTPTPFNLANVMAGLARADAGEQGLEVAYVAGRTWRDLDTLDCQSTNPVPARGAQNGYEIILVGGGNVYVYHTDEDSTVIQCAVMPLADVPGDLLIKFDLTAADLFAVSQRDLADRLGIPVRQVRLREMQVMVWQDASLGCPRDGQTYAPVRITGYRIVLTTGTQNYNYHTDFDRAIPCDTNP